MDDRVPGVSATKDPAVTFKVARPRKRPTRTRAHTYARINAVRRGGHVCANISVCQRRKHGHNARLPARSQRPSREPGYAGAVSSVRHFCCEPTAPKSWRIRGIVCGVGMRRRWENIASVPLGGISARRCAFFSWRVFVVEENRGKFLVEL